MTARGDGPQQPNQLGDPLSRNVREADNLLADLDQLDCNALNARDWEPKEAEAEVD